MKKIRIFINILLVWALYMPANVYAQKVYTLYECRQMALQNNIKMRDAMLTIDQAREQEKEAYSKYFPNVFASGMVFKSSDYLIKKKLSLSDDEQQDLAKFITQLGLNSSALAMLPSSYTIKLIDRGAMANIVAMEPIYAGGQITNSNRLAKLQTEVRKLQMQQSHDEILSTTEIYYNQLLTLYEKEQTLNVVDSQLKRIHNDADNAFKAGVKNKNDVLAVELKQNEMATERLKLENAIKLCKMVLAQYIGVTDTDINIDKSLTNEIKEPTTYFVDHITALNGRTEALLLDKNVQSNELQRKIKTGAMLPTVSLGVTGGYQNIMGTDGLNVIGLATIRIPISSLWSDKYAVRHQQIAEQIAKQDRDDKRQMLLIQMQSAYNDFLNAYRQIDLAKKSIEKSTENLRLNEDYYQVGTSTMGDLLNAQTTDRQARNQYSDAITQYLNYRTAYLLATGRQVE